MRSHGDDKCDDAILCHRWPHHTLSNGSQPASDLEPRRRALDAVDERAPAGDVRWLEELAAGGGVGAQHNQLQSK